MKLRIAVAWIKFLCIDLITGLNYLEEGSLSTYILFQKSPDIRPFLFISRQKLFMQSIMKYFRIQSGPIHKIINWIQSPTIQFLIEFLGVLLILKDNGTWFFTIWLLAHLLQIEALQRVFWVLANIRRGRVLLEYGRTYLGEETESSFPFIGGVQTY